MADLALAGALAGPGRFRHALLARRSGWVVLVLIVALHLLAADELAGDRFGWGHGERPPPRIEVAFVRKLEQSAPPALAPATAAATAARALPSVAQAPAQAASAPAAASMAAATPLPKSAPPTPVPPPLAVPEPAPAPPPSAAPPATAVAAQVPPWPSGVDLPPAAGTAPSPVAPVVADPPASSPAAPAFDWPPSTRLSYTLSGYYRGPIEGGRAQVEWLRSGARYQVRMESSVGPMFSRQAHSDGELTERGLVPRRFDGEQKQILRAPRRWTQQFGNERITLPDGREIEAVAGVQDEASQYVQLTWLFTTQPQLLQVGKTIELPLVLSRRFYRWTYEVAEQQTLSLPFGAVPTYHLKSRRQAEKGDLTAEMWFAPTLQYLPVRILLRQDESTFIELTLNEPPMQAGK